MIIWDNPSKHWWILSCGSELTGMYVMCIWVFPISMLAHLPSSISSSWCFIVLYSIPFFIKKPTPLQPRNACSWFAPYHSYPRILNSSYPLRWVSDSARISDYSLLRNSIILYFLAIIPFTFTWTTFSYSFYTLIVVFLVIWKNSSSIICLGSLCSSFSRCS